jgi:hypothetical protein
MAVRGAQIEYFRFANPRIGAQVAHIFICSVPAVQRSEPLLRPVLAVNLTARR